MTFNTSNSPTICKLCSHLALCFLVVILCGCRNTNEDDRDTIESSEVSENEAIKFDKESLERMDIAIASVEVVDYTPTAAVYGRVIPNPNATYEITAPFAGTLQSNAWPMLGAELTSDKQIATLSVRSTPEARADLQNRLLEAQTRLEHDAAIVASQQRIVDGLQSVTRQMVVSRAELDTALSNLEKAKSQTAVDDAAVKFWGSVLESIKNQSPAPTEIASMWAMPVVVPRSGQVVEVPVVPPAYVEAGQLIIRVIDTSRQLMRLEVPFERAREIAGMQDIALEYEGASFHADYVGTAPSVDLSSQLKGFWYEISDATGMIRPGMILKASLPMPNGKVVSASRIPSAAAIIHEGKWYVFKYRGDERFERQEIIVLARLPVKNDTVGTVSANPDIVCTGLHEGDQIVVSHASLMLSRELLQVGGDTD